MRVRLADIARKAGVSPITVSRALRGETPVAEETRRRILASAGELGYVPNMLARALIKNQTATVGVLITELASPFFAPMVSGIETVAEARDFLVVIGESGIDLERERRQVDRFQQLRIAGIIVTPVARDVTHLEAARSTGTPVVVLARRWEAGDYVSTDNLEGGRIVARHLLERGHRRVGVIRLEDVENAVIRERVEGFLHVLGAAGLEVPPAWDLRTPRARLEDGIEAARQFLALTSRPTAVFATTDRLAIGLMQELTDRGVRIPSDLSVVGFDDIPFAASARVALSTVAIPMFRMGELAAEILFHRLDRVGGHDNCQVLLRPELVVRASSS